MSGASDTPDTLDLRLHCNLMHEDKKGERTRSIQEHSPDGLCTPCEAIGTSTLLALGGICTIFASNLHALQGCRLPDLSCVFVALPGHDRAADVEQTLCCPLTSPLEPQVWPPWQLQHLIIPGALSKEQWWSLSWVQSDTPLQGRLFFLL